MLCKDHEPLRYLGDADKNFHTNHDRTHCLSSPIPLGPPEYMTNRFSLHSCVSRKALRHRASELCDRRLGLLNSAVV